MTHTRLRTRILSFAAGGLLVGLTLGPGTAAFAATPTPTPHVKVVDLGISDILSLLKTGKTTSEALVSAYLDRIKAYDHPYGKEPGLSAILAVNTQALATARILDSEHAAGKTRGPLHGVPILVKDNIATVDMPTSAGNGAMRDYRTEADATTVKRLRAAGAIILAKTNLAEFALTGDGTQSFFGTTTNPYNQKLDVSGSSGGNAAAVAASFAAGAIGTDTAGSIVGPSANGALVGLRPTFGLTSQNGVVPGNLAADVVGPMAKSVKDAALLLQVIAGYDPADPNTKETRGIDTGRYVSGLSSTSLRGARIGVPADWAAYIAGPGAFFGISEPSVKKVYDHAITELESRGAVIVPVAYDATTLTVPPVPADFDHQVQDFLLHTKAKVPAAIAALAPPADVFDLNDVVASKDTTLGELFAQVHPSPTPSAEYEAALATVPAARKQFAAFFEANRIEAMVLPSVAVAGTQSVDGSVELTSKAGAPGVTVPAGYDTETGRPLGIKLIGERYKDGRLLSLAYDYERATKHRVAPKSVPELPGGTVPAVEAIDTRTITWVSIGGALALAVFGLTIYLYRRRNGDGARRRQ